MQIPTNIQAIIFDYDGVLGDSDAFNTYACKESAKKCGIQLSTGIYRKCAPGGATIKDIATCIVTHYGMPEKVQEYIFYKQGYDKDYAKEVEILPHAQELVAHLASKYPLAINTGTRHVLVDSFIAKYNLARYLKVVIAAEDIHIGKPNPESYQLACFKLGIEPSNCLVVEDGSSGIISAKAAGCYVIGITSSLNESRLRELGCDQIISDLSQLMAPNGT